MYIRLGRGRDPEVYGEVPDDLQIGKAIRLREGADLTIVATGSEVRACLDAADSLAADGIHARVVDMHTVDPLDREEILAAADETGAVLTVEEHNVTGGLGSAVAETLAERASAWRSAGSACPTSTSPSGRRPPSTTATGSMPAGVESVVRDFIGAERERHHG